jgi:hypothetical protein
VIRFMCAMHAIVSSDAARGRMSEVLAIVAMALLILYIADGALEFLGNSRFIPLSINDRG